MQYWRSKRCSLASCPRLLEQAISEWLSGGSSVPITVLRLLMIRLVVLENGAQMLHVWDELAW
jgi:hypothetical protein